LTRCTELGAHRFLLLQAERSVSRASRPERWAAICREAAMLAGRLTIPVVEGPLPAAAVIARPETLLLDAGTGRPLAGGGLGSPVTLAIGPEGGWTDAERSLAGERERSLGELTLRADTAAVAALATALASDAEDRR
jgi:16S rRNA (uracil1498-N3)-methyltransferase